MKNNGASMVGRRKSERSSIHHSQFWTIATNLRTLKKCRKLGEIIGLLSIFD
jgi:hypothetical protein